MHNTEFHNDIVRINTKKNVLCIQIIRHAKKRCEKNFTVHKLMLNFKLKLGTIRHILDMLFN